MEKQVSKKKSYWTFQGVILHLKNGKVVDDEALRTLSLVEEGPLLLPKKFTCSQRQVKEKIHDMLYNTLSVGPEIGWVELLNVKEYK